MGSGTGLAEETITGDEPAVTAACIEFLKAATLARHPSGPRRRFKNRTARGEARAAPSRARKRRSRAQ